MRVLLFEPRAEDATSFYRSRGVLPYLSRKNNIELIPSRVDGFTWAQALMGDVAFFQRPNHSSHARAMITLKECGVRVICDYDDDFFNIPEHNPVYAPYAANRQNIIDCIALADDLIVSTQTLADVYSPHARDATPEHIHIVPNAHNDYMFPVERKKPFSYNKNAYYRGGTTHQWDVFKHADQIVSMIKKNTDWKFYFIGDRFPFLEAQTEGLSNHMVAGVVPMMDFFQLLIKMNPCVHFSFLENNKFNHSKSNCAWIEATYAGATSFATGGLPEFVKTPAIICNDIDDAFEHFQDKDFLKSRHDKSWEYICQNLLLSTVNERRLEIIMR